MGERADVVLINQYFCPSDAATAVLLGELAEDLCARYELTVVCESAFAGPAPSGYSCVRLPPPSWIHDDDAVASRGLRWLSSFLFLTRISWWVLTARRHSLFIIASEPPFLDSVVGSLCWMKGQKFLIVVQDLYPEFAAAVDLRPVSFFAKPLAWWHTFVARRSSGVIAISKDHAQLLKRRGIVARACIPNWAPTSCGEIVEESQPLLPMQGPLILHYAGNLGLACDLDALEVALTTLASQGQLEHFRVVLRGDGIKRHTARRLAEKFSQVSIAARVPVGAVSHEMGRCHAHLVLTPGTLQGCVYPSKVNSILAAGRPVIASVPRESSIGEFITTQGVGYVSPAEDPSQLASAMLRCLRDMRENPAIFQEMGRRGRSYVSSQWNRQMAVDQYQRLIEEVLHDHNS